MWFVGFVSRESTPEEIRAINARKAKAKEAVDAHKDKLELVLKSKKHMLYKDEYTWLYAVICCICFVMVICFPIARPRWSVLQITLYIITIVIFLITCSIVLIVLVNATYEYKNARRELHEYMESTQYTAVYPSNIKQEEYTAPPATSYILSLKHNSTMNEEDRERFIDYSISESQYVL